VKGDILRRGEVDVKTEIAMHDLFSRQFEQVSLEQFVADLDEKNWVLLLRRDDGTLSGFSSMHIYDFTSDGRDLKIVYSGDTVVDSQLWSDSALSYCWMGAVDYLRKIHDEERLCWFLLVSGFRTYRFLPVYSEHFYPRYDQATPDDIQRLMNALAIERFGDRYDEQTGIVRLEVPAVLRDGFRGIPENRLTDPHIAFFAEKNPGHERGDELVCFAELSEDRYTRLGRRMLAKGRRLFADGRTK
jgi:hypothetical protein